MSDQETTSRDLPKSALTALVSQVSGHLVRPSDPEYGDARRVWNGMIDRYPAAILRCESNADVAAGIRFAREAGLAISVRSGGHNVAGFGTCDNGLVLDLSRMRSVDLDPAAGVARIGGGHTWGSFDAALADAGLHTTGGLVSTTGVAGFTLGGGIGWLQRRHGLACDNLVGADVVTADGTVVRAGADGDPDLLWGLRGGGGNFGVVTSMTFRVHPVATVTGGMAMFPAARAAEVLQAFGELSASADHDLTLVAAMITAPPAPFVPADLQGRPAIALAACHAGDPAAGERALRPVKALGPSADLLGPMPYNVLQTMLDPTAPAGQRQYWKSGYLRSLEPAFLTTLLEWSDRKPVPFGQVHLHQMGGAVARIGRQATAFAHRDAAFTLNIIGTWDRADEDEAGIAWARGAFGAVAPWTDGVYVNFLGSEGEDRIRDAYGSATYARLARLKRRLDPDNIFHLNQNIRPAAVG
jgi:FAD/FMN-containing dehydrogenase